MLTWVIRTVPSGSKAWKSNPVHAVKCLPESMKPKVSPVSRMAGNRGALLPALAEQARARLKRLEYGNIQVRTGDGYRGWRPVDTGWDVGLQSANRRLRDLRPPEKAVRWPNGLGRAPCRLGTQTGNRARVVRFQERAWWHHQPTH